MGLVQRAQLKVLQNTHLLPPSPLNVQVLQTVFPFSPEHLQSCLASEVIYLRCGHKRRTKSKKSVERKAEESKQTLTPVECLSSPTELRINEGLSTLAAAAVKGGREMPESSPSRYQASCTPITRASPVILRGNLTTLMAALSLQAVFTNTGCAMVAP